MFKTLNWGGALAALIYGQALSFLWYGTAFAAAERAMFPDAPSGPMVYAEGAALSLLLVIGLAWIVSATSSRGWMAGLRTGVVFWVLILLPIGLMNPVYMGTSLKQAQIDLGYELLFLAGAGALIGGLTVGRRRLSAPT